MKKKKPTLIVVSEETTHICYIIRMDPDTEKIKINEMNTNEGTEEEKKA